MAPRSADDRRTSGQRWAALAVGLLIWSAGLAWLDAGAPGPRDDPWEYGVVARHLIAGDGFRTTVIHPPLWSLRAPDGTVGMWVHGPLLPLMVAPWIRIGGERALEHVAWLGAVLVLLAAWFAARAAARSWGATAGAATLILIALSPLSWNAAAHDLSMAVGALAIAVAIDQTWRFNPRGLTAGLALGIGALARPELTIAALVSLPLLKRGEDRWRALAGLALPLGALWAARAFGALPNGNLSELLLVCYTQRWPELSALRDFHLAPGSLARAIGEAAPGLVAKWTHQAPRALFHLLSAPSYAAAPLAVAHLYLSYLRCERPARLALLLLVAIPVGLITLTEPSPRYVMMWTPIAALAAIGGARHSILLRRMRPALALSIPLLLTLPFAVANLSARAREAPGLRAAIEAERRTLRPLAVAQAHGADVLFSDRPDLDAWITGRSVVWLERAEFERLPTSDAPETRLVPRRGPETLGWFHENDLAAGRFVSAHLRPAENRPSMAP